MYGLQVTILTHCLYHPLESCKRLVGAISALLKWLWRSQQSARISDEEALADELYRQEHGTVMERWNSLAATLVASPDFTRKNLSGKTAQNRMNALLGL